MLNITPVSFLKNNYNIKNNTLNTSTKLKPLPYDTVSFSGAREFTDLGTIVREKAKSSYISENAVPAEEKLKKTLNDNLSNYIISDSNSGGIIEPIQTRIKTPGSIEEKVISIILEGICKNPSKVFKIEDYNSIKKHLNDIIGARIILTQSNPNRNSVIIQKLIKMIENNTLKIDRIEYLAPPKKEGVDPYFNKNDLKKLEMVVKKKYGEDAYKKEERKSGYSALHIDVDLSDDDMIARYNGYHAEIQIMGPDVAYFKDLEDYCYKVKQNKNIRSNHPAYNAFVEHLNKYFKYEDPLKTKEQNKAIAKKNVSNFEKYTYRAYLVQRKKNPQDSNYNKNGYPTLKECEMEGIIPPQYDFNYLAKLKENCDKLYELSTKANIDEKDVEKIIKYNNLMNETLEKQEIKTIVTIKKLLSDAYWLMRPQK